MSEEGPEAEAFCRADGCWKKNSFIDSQILVFPEVMLPAFVLNTCEEESRVSFLAF